MANRYTDAVFHAHIPAVDKAVLWAVAHRTDNETGACHPSILTISKEAGASKTIVKQVIAYCVEIGILVQAVRKNGKAFLANEYTFNLSGLRWLERADSRYGPDGETDTGLRANVGKLPAQGGSQPRGGLVSGPGVYRRPAQGWGGSQPKNSEVDLRIGTHHSNSEETAPDQTQEQQASPETTKDSVLDQHRETLDPKKLILQIDDDDDVLPPLPVHSQAPAARLIPPPAAAYHPEAMDLHRWEDEEPAGYVTCLTCGVKAADVRRKGTRCVNVNGRVAGVSA